jgi:hypothetical protein
LQSTSLSFAEFAKSKSSKNNTISCCKTTFESLKLKDNYIGAYYIKNLGYNLTHALLFALFRSEKQWLNLQPQFLKTNLSPPTGHGIPIYIFDCVYRI